MWPDTAKLFTSPLRPHLAGAMCAHVPSCSSLYCWCILRRCVNTAQISCSQMPLNLPRDCQLRLICSGSSSGVVRQNWNGTEKITMAPRKDDTHKSRSVSQFFYHIPLISITARVLTFSLSRKQQVEEVLRYRTYWSWESVWLFPEFHIHGE